MADPPARPAAQARLPWWTLPSVVLGRIRPGLAERAAEDAAWVSRFPPLAATAILPLLVVAIPVAFAGARAFDTTPVNAVEFTFHIQDVYIESIPFMVIAAAIGLAAPTLGVLFLASHMIADLAAAFIQPLEMEPLPTAFAGRLVSFWLLYLLVAELPMAVHEISGWVRVRAPRALGGPLMVVVGAAAGAAFAWIWGAGATLLIRPVFTWSHLYWPTANAGWPLLSSAGIFALVVGGAALLLFGFRYLILPAAARPAQVAASGGMAGLGPIVFGIVVPIVLFSSLITQPIDAVVLAVAVLGARPISAFVLRRTGLARPLAGILRPVRLIGGVAVSFGVGYLIASVLGVSTISDFFTMVVAMAVGFVLTRILLDADDFGSSVAAPPSLAAGVGASLVVGMAIWLFSAGPTFADNIGNQGDGWGTAAAAAGAAAGAGGLAAGSASKKKKEPNPPPWYVPDSFADFFGYDTPGGSPPDPKKPPPDPNKPPPGWPKQRPPGQY